MALSTIFANLPTGNNAASLIDTNMTELGAMGILQCTCAGTNTLTLTQNSNQPTVSSYNNYLAIGFVAAATSTGSLSANLNGIGSLNIYTADNITQATTGDIEIGTYYILIYNSALNSGGGGFQLINATYASGAWTPALLAASTAGTPAYSSQVGSYIKIGRLVVCDFFIVLSGWTGSPSGTVQITGLPFTCSGTNFGNSFIGQYAVSGLASLNYGMGGIVGTGTTMINLHSFGNTQYTNVTAAQLGTTPTLIGNAVYHI